MSYFNYSFPATLEIGGEDVDVTISYTIEPAQRGGRTDPSWDAYADEYEVTVDGKVVEVPELEETIFKLCEKDMNSYGD
jgi:hypothetical protein